MRRRITCAAALCLLCLLRLCAVHSEGLKQAMQAYLTDYAGYTAQEAESAVYTLTEDGLTVHPEGLEEVTYTMVSSAKEDPAFRMHLTADGERVYILAPFSEQLGPRYLSEETVHTGIRMGLDNGWFVECGGTNLLEMTDWITKNLHPGRVAQARLQTDYLPCVEAVHLYFTLAFGEVTRWNRAVYALEQKVLDICHVHYEPSFLPEIGESLTYQGKEGQVQVSFALFGEEVPEEVRSILAAAGKTWLTEREILCGYMENGGFTGAQVLLVVQGKDGQRMLVALTRGYREETWRVTVAGSDCLLQEGLIDIIPGNGFGRYAVRMQPEEGRQIHLFFDVFQEGTVLSGLDILEAQDRRLTRLSRGRWESYSWAYGEREETCRFVGKLPYRCEYLDLHTVLDGLSEQLVAAEDVETIPTVDSGMCITKGEVHFRQDHSSHSADLGMLRPGVPLEILDMVPGTEAAWYKVQLGPMTGWVSGDYVSVGAPDVEAKTMQVARGRQELTLKNRPGIFSLSAGRLSTEQYVYVLLEKGSEAYVLLPDSGITVPAEMEGTYGWVRTSDLMEGAAPVSLIWENE